MTDGDALLFRLRPCWVLADNLRLSREGRPWDEPCLRALVLETVKVREEVRRRGVFKRFLRVVCSVPGYELVVVEAVQNPILAEALMRWGWDFDSEVMDFYFRPAPGKEPCS